MKTDTCITYSDINIQLIMYLLKLQTDIKVSKFIIKLDYKYNIKYCILCKKYFNL